MNTVEIANLPPVRLLYCLQGWPPPGPNHFRWQEGRLIYSLPDRSKPPAEWDRAADPTPAQWAEFWHVCDEIEVWSWPASVGDREVIDGLQSELELEVAGRAVKSEGQCHGSPVGFQEHVMRLHQTLQALVGWPKAGGS